ncbi:MAG TPA: CAP domain-containing protein [Nitrospirota bacterium]|nr:CAP domain-containing protein [Nitrospirota bacterium]
MTNRTTLLAYRLAIAACAWILLVLSCTATRPVETQQRFVHKKQPRIDTAGLARQIHRLINDERKKHGLSLLAWDDALAAIARGHSRDMAARNYFSHFSQEGHDFSYRYRQAGYQCSIRRDRTVYLGAENILQNNLYDSVTAVNGEKFYDWNSSEKIAETSVQGWMNSKGHRENILTPHWGKEGIGVFIAPDDKVYITQNFC